MAISLGRQYTLSIAGVTIAGVRDVTVNRTSSEINFQPYGSRSIYAYTTGYSIDLSFETIDSAWFDAGEALLISGEQTPVVITDSGNTTVWAFSAVVTSMSDAQPLEGVRSVQTTLKRYFFDAGDPLRAGDTSS